MTVLQGQWKSDGSDDPSRDDRATHWEVTTTEENNNNIDGSSSQMDIYAKGGSPMNFMYELKEESLFVVQVQVIHMEGGSVSVGVVSPTDFQAGWKLRNAKLCNGTNLTSGAAAIQVNFGPHPIQSGDTMVVERTSTQIIFYLNQNCLGCGFELSTSNPPFLVPCLSIMGNVQLQVSILSSLPFHDSSTTTPQTDLSGTYHILEAHDDSGENVWIPFMDGSMTVGGTSDVAENQKPIALSISQGKEPDGYHFSIKVCNSLSVTKKILATNGNSPRYTLSTDDLVLSSRVLAPPPYEEVERKCSKLLSNGWHSIEPSTTSLTFFNADQQPIMTCRRS